jgi:flagellar biosynthetic protein FliP
MRRPPSSPLPPDAANDGSQNMIRASDVSCRRFFLPVLGLAALITPEALPQTISVDLGTGQGLTSGIVQMIAAITVLSLAPSILVMTTSVRADRGGAVAVAHRDRPAERAAELGGDLAVAVPHRLRDGADLHGVLRGGHPALHGRGDHAGRGDPARAGPRAGSSWARMRTKRTWRCSPAWPRSTTCRTRRTAPFHVLAPAFMISELKRAFEIGFMVFLPFLVIDLVVSSILMAMGMMMLPPVTISLPFKLIFFVLVDGWRLLAGSLVESFMTLPPS